MFENLLCQDNVKKRLVFDIKNKKLPPSILLSGPAYSGKMTAALEIARVLHCERDATWNCPCSHCNEHRLLNNAETLMLGSRYFLEEVKASRQTYILNISPAGKFMYIRAIRKFLNRFNQNIWSTDDAKYKKNESILSRINENMESVLIEESKISESKKRKSLDQIETDMEKILSGNALNQVTIDQIRNIISWTHRSSQNKKIVIIENAEKMNDSSRNSLLKILEEPPSGLYFILLSSNDGAIIPTIKSRVRRYQFKIRSDNDQQEIIKKIFRLEEAAYSNLNVFFLQQSSVPYSDIEASAAEYFSGLNNRSDYYEIQNLPDKRNSTGIFLHLLTQQFHNYFSSSECSFSSDQLTRVIRLIKDGNHQMELFNQNPSLILESLFYRLRGLL